MPAAAGPNATGRPTGILFSSTGFAVAPGKNASFTFCSLDGTISGWNSTDDATHSVIMVDNSASGARYEGCGMATTDTGPQIYAPNFSSGDIDVYDANWAAVTLPAGAFKPFRNRLTGEGSKPPPAAADKSCGSEQGRKRTGKIGSGDIREEERK